MSEPRFRSEHDEPIPGFGAERMGLYARATVARGPRELLVTALERFVAGHDDADITSRARTALDLGCGLGQETALLLERGWRVTACDASAQMLESTLSRAGAAESAGRLTLIHAPFDRIMFDADSFDLIHAGFSLPFCPARHFPRLWQSLVRALRPGGVFVGQFFGPDDQFVRTSPPGDMSVHAADDLGPLLGGFDLLHHDEVNRPGETAAGSPKHWHVHHVIARKAARS